MSEAKSLRILRLRDVSQEQRDGLFQRAGQPLREAMIKVSPIVEDVRQRRDAALREYSMRFDKVSLEELAVPLNEFEEAFNKARRPILAALEEASGHIEAFHRSQIPQEQWVDVAQGIRVGTLWRPIEKVGLYVPRGSSGYPSSVLMLGIPAMLAGCSKVVLCTPPAENGRLPDSVILAAGIAGINDIYKVGGPQAIAAMAYGTESIPKVDKVFGPGRTEVTAAKLLVMGTVAIDMPAGPSEALVIADEEASPAFAAADLLAQAEHSPDAISILITTSQELAQAVVAEVEKQGSALYPDGSLKETLYRNGAAIIIDSLEEAVDLANRYAPEHLSLMIKDPLEILPSVSQAGSVFLGPYSPQAGGDYATGANHVLPTGGQARGFSALSVRAFMREMQVQEVTQEGLKGIRTTVSTLAQAEGFVAHRNAVNVRLPN